MESDAASKGLRTIAWYDSPKPLRSGWAWGQEALNGTAAIIEAPARGWTDPTILAARRKAMRNLLGTLLLSAGIPMLTAGDEFGDKRLADICFITNIEDTHLVNYALKKLQGLGYRFIESD